LKKIIKMGRKKVVVDPVEEPCQTEEASPQADIHDSPCQDSNDSHDGHQEPASPLPEAGSDALIALLTEEQRERIYHEQKRKRDREYQREYYKNNHEKMKNRGKEKYAENKDVKIRAEAGIKPKGRPRIE